MRMRHGAPVESALIYPTGGGGVAVSAGGPVVRAWDLMMGGRGLKAVSNHQKTITSLALSMSTGAEGSDVGEGGAGGMRLLSAGVDGLVKVYDPARDYTVVHTMRYPAPILSLAISPEERELAVGMADGTLCVRKRQVRKGEDEARAYARRAIVGGGVEAFVTNGDDAAAVPGVDAAARDEAARKRQMLLARDDVRAETVRARRLKPYESLLRSFRYSEAIDASLGPGVPAAARDLSTEPTQ